MLATHAAAYVMSQSDFGTVEGIHENQGHNSYWTTNVSTWLCSQQLGNFLKALIVTQNPNNVLYIKGWNNILDIKYFIY